MKKKVFSLMMMLLLTASGFVRADELTVFDGTVSSSMIPVYGLYADTQGTTSEFVIPAGQLSAMNGGSISSMKFYLSSSAEDAWTATFQVYLNEVPATTLSTPFGPTSGTVVYEGTLDASGNTMTVNFTTPYTYNGGNLLVGTYVKTAGYWESASFVGQTAENASVCVYNPWGTPNVSTGSFGAKTTFTYTPGQGGGNTPGGGGSADSQLVAVQDSIVVDTVLVGVRPNGCWMEPFKFQMRNDGEAITLNLIDFTPREYFTVVGPELPVRMANGETIDVKLATGTSTNTEWQMVGIYEGARTAKVWTIMAEPYDPECPDVWEKAYDVTNETFPFVETPMERLETYQMPQSDYTQMLHNDYTLPFPEIAEGYDAVYKLTVAEDAILNAYVSYGDSAGSKVAVYTEDFNGKGGPMADNNYTGFGLASGNRDNLTYDFEDGILGWTTIDADGDGYDWMLHAPDPDFISDLGHEGSDYYVHSQSYDNDAGVALTPDNYLVSPSKAEYTAISFWACAQDPSYAAEHFGVAVSTAGNTSASDFTMVQEWTMTAKSAGNAGNYASRSREGSRGTWYEYTVDLSAYAGQEIWVAIRHFNCTDMFILNVDDITIVEGAGGVTPPPGPTPGPNPTPNPVANISAGPVVEGLPLTPGTYYIVASSITPDFELTIGSEPMPCPEVDGFAFNPYPADDQDSIQPSSVKLTWQTPVYATEWRVVFGSTYYPEANHPQTIITDWSNELTNSYTVTNLWNNTNYFWHVEFRNGACTTAMSSPIWGFTTHLNIPQNLTVEDDEIFIGDTVKLSWTAVVDRTYRNYFVYRDGEKIGETTANQIGLTTFTDNGPLDYDMTGYTYYVTAVYDEGESAPSNTVTVKVSGEGTVSGYVYEQDSITGIAGATVTLVGTDEFGDEHTYTATTNNNGFYTATVYVGSYKGSASCPGYQSVTAPVQGNPIPVVYNMTTTPINYILDENFDGPCTVVAEYYPDSLDPESPYVKVYWGCGLRDGAENDRRFSHYRVYRTYCSNDGPYDSINTMVLACEYTDTVFIDTYWNDPVVTPPGFYKWGIGVVYVGNRGEEIETPVVWTQPVAPAQTEDATRDVILTQDFENGLGDWTIVNGASLLGSTGVQDAISAYPAHGGNKYFLFHYTYNPPQYLISPLLTGSGNIDVSFFYRAAFASYFVETFHVGYSTTTNDPDAFTFGEEITSPAVWTEYTNSFPAGTKYVAIKHTANNQFYFFVDDITITASGGSGGNTGGGATGNDPIQEPRESVIVWSNCLEKDMYMSDVDVTVLLNSADSPEGAVVRFTNYDEEEQQNHPVEPITLDESGYYAFQTFRRGAYKVMVEKDGYYPIVDSINLITPPQNLVNEMHLRYVMTEILYGVRNIYVSRTGWAMWEDANPNPNPNPNPDPNPNPGEGDTFTEGFENGLNGWTVLKVNATGGEWLHSSDNPGEYEEYELCAHGGTGFAMCYSFVDYVGSFNTDSYLITPQKYSIVNGSTLTFWADNANDMYPEPFSVCVATADNPSAADFTTVWSGEAKANGGAKANVRRSETRYDNWRQHTIDLSAYAGQNVYIAFHDASEDCYEIWIDDVELSVGRVTDDRHFESYKVMCTSIDGVPIFNHNTVHPFCQVATEYLEEGKHYLVKVAAVYSTGMSEWSELVEWEYEPCEHWGPVDVVNVSTGSTGNNISWVFEHGFNVWNDDDTISKGVNKITHVQNVYSAPVFSSGMQAEGFYVINITDIAKFDERIYFTYKLNNDVRFDVVRGEAEGMFIVHPSAGYEDMDLEEAVNDFMAQNAIEYGRMDKVQAAEVANAYKALLPADFVISLMMDVYANTRENNRCEFADPFCTDNGMYEFPAGVNAGTGEVGPFYDCLYTTPNPAWYFMRIGNPGSMDIYMYSTPLVDIDFCCWGPFDDPTASCPNGLTEDKVVSCSYSPNPTEHCMIPATAQTGEYYIMVITNYSNESCNINFSEVSGNGTTDCNIVSPVDIIGFLITQDGEYLDFVEPTVRNYVHAGETGNHEYCVRAIYPGPAEMPSNNYNWSMSCPVCVGNQTACAPGAPIHAEALSATDQVRIWWEEGSSKGSDLTSYRVYRSKSAIGGYTLIGEVAANSRGFYEYIDSPATVGTFYYQVTAVYGNDCESDPAPSYSDPSVDYVDASVTSIDENGSNVSLYPNPTSGNVTIVAQGMSRVTVMSVLGQVVYDSENNADECTINMSQFNAGMYVVRIVTETGIHTQRVTVVR